MSETTTNDEHEDDFSDDAKTDHHCQFCCGDGWHECDDPIQCTYQHNAFGECRCSSCGGSGLAKDQTIW
jgi:hypothetical protein